MTDEGVIYYAVGDAYVEEAKTSAASLKRHNDVETTVFTDAPELDHPAFDDVVTIDPGEHPFYDRIHYFRQSPYERTLYLDTDTVVAGDIGDVFEMLDRFDIVAAINETRDNATEPTPFLPLDLDVPDSFPEYQCGVIGFADNGVVSEVFDEWQERYKEYKHQNVLDQPFFREVIYNNRNVDIGTLPPEFNLLVNFCGYVQEEVKIIHFVGDRRREVDLPFVGDRDAEAIIDKLNERGNSKRVFYYDGLNRMVIKPNSRVPMLFVGSLSRNGVMGTIKRVVEEISRRFR